MVPPPSHGIPRVPRYSGYNSLILTFAYMTLTFFGVLSHTLRLAQNNAKCCPYPKGISTSGLASFPFARHYSENLGWFLFLALLRCFSSGGSPHIPMYSVYDVCAYTYGLLHSEICGSPDTCSSPQLIAAYHVLLRLLMPRHSPYALFSFTISELCFLVSFSC